MPVKLNKNAIERHEVIEIHFPVAQCALRYIDSSTLRADGRRLARKHIGPRARVGVEDSGVARGTRVTPMPKRARRRVVRLLSNRGAAAAMVVGRFREVLRWSLTGTLTPENRGRRAVELSVKVYVLYSG